MCSPEKRDSSNAPWFATAGRSMWKQLSWWLKSVFKQKLHPTFTQFKIFFAQQSCLSLRLLPAELNTTGESRPSTNNNNSMSTVLPAGLNETGELRPSNNNNSMSRVMPAELSATGELRQTLLKTKTFATFHSKRNSCGEQDKRQQGLDIARSILNVAIIHRPPGLSVNIPLKEIPFLSDGRNLRKAVRPASHSLWHVS